MGERQARLKDAFKGDAAVDLAPLMKVLESRCTVEVVDSGGGAIEAEGGA